MVVPASKTNLGWNQQGADGLTAVAKELGITAKIQENGGYDDITPTLKDLKRRRRAADHLPRLRLPDGLPGVRRGRARCRSR